eukprot:15469534-Alexandrium_andersonii.AAC.1
MSTAPSSHDARRRTAAPTPFQEKATSCERVSNEGDAVTIVWGGAGHREGRGHFWTAPGWGRVEGERGRVGATNVPKARFETWFLRRPDSAPQAPADKAPGFCPAPATHARCSDSASRYTAIGWPLPRNSGYGRNVLQPAARCFPRAWWGRVPPQSSVRALAGGCAASHRSHRRTPRARWRPHPL